MKKIAIFTETSSWGGISTYCLQLSKKMISENYNVILVCPLDKRTKNRSVIEYCRKNNIPYKTILINSKYDSKAIGLITDFLIEKNIDIIHTNAYRFNIIIKICRLILSLKGKKLEHIVTVHGTFIRKHKGDRLWFYHLIDDLTAFSHTTTICVSKYTRDIFLKRAFLVNPLKVKVIYLGLPIRLYNDTKSQADAPCIMFAGRLEEEKGISLLCSIISRYLELHPNFQGIFNIYGEGTLKKLVLKLENNFPGKVVYHGYSNNLERAFKDNHILLVTSITETFGMVILEAASYGTLTIANNVGGIPEIIQHNKNGVLVNSGRVDDFVSELNNIIINKKWITMHNEIRSINNTFSLNKMTKEMTHVYKLNT